jgi:fumarate hydratase class II
MLVTALSPVIGSDKASKIAHYAMDNDQDRQRHSPDVLRTSRGICGIGNPGE